MPDLRDAIFCLACVNRNVVGGVLWVGLVAAPVAAEEPALRGVGSVDHLSDLVES